MRPDLGDPEARAAYRRELRGLARGWRWLGLALVTTGAIAFIYDAKAARHDPAIQWSAWALLAIGWAVLIGVIAYRTRYNMRRMREGGTP